MSDVVNERKIRERHYYTVPVFAPRKTIADETRVVGWKWQIYDGWGRIIHESPRGTLYGSAQEAIRVAMGFEEEL